MIRRKASSQTPGGDSLVSDQRPEAAEPPDAAEATVTEVQLKCR
jgi:hypothetical protein